ncbi:MAG: hypothetical protein CVV57_00005 [Tenericutes bacterium HGW-Tenericutes-2]|nr:MAG: hypothetical protein CVV57_00005 [Tenericutes bacterium HGW-Tenericutes-2]
MKKMSIVLILLSCALTIFSHLINQIDSLFFSLPMFYPSVDLFIRFGDLLIIFGFIGLFLSTKKHPKIKVFSFIFALLGILRFLVIDFGVTESYHLVPNILLFLQVVVLTLWILEVKTIQVPLLTIKGYSLIIISFIYYISVQILSLLPNNQSNPTIVLIPFFLMAYQIGLWIFFKEWYKEAYIYKNPDLSRI